ncbi:hypothetical protein [Romboutsia lituseburensis]|uniref:hypothetical protein n=1 Tax=Romboutsia lituseburensis TaxID=1537 RepID=UPI0022EB0AE8|nr:hypothetical protein [Romboutsia lituseburensis]
MPSVKQGGGYTLTFAKKNQDVKSILDDKKKNKIIITDYICEAIRFYEGNRNREFNNNNTISNIDIEKLIEDKIKVALGSNISNKINGDLTNEVEEYNLEDTRDIDDCDIEED